MTPISLTAAGEDAGARLDAFLAQRLPALTHAVRNWNKRLWS